MLRDPNDGTELKMVRISTTALHRFLPVAFMLIYSQPSWSDSPATQPDTSAGVVWDFSKNNLLSNIKERLDWVENFGFLKGPGQIWLAFKDGAHGTLDYDKVEVVRDDRRPDRIRLIIVHSRPVNQTRTANYATKVAREWGIPTESIETFRRMTSKDWRFAGVPIITTLRLRPDGSILPNQPSPYQLRVTHHFADETFALSFLAPLRAGYEDATTTTAPSN